nr:MAG TPA: hypothetical protein [Caudoviricetes sp.]
MKALIYITMFLMSGIWLSSCKTSRNIDTQKQVDYSGEFQHLRKVMEELRIDLSKQTKIVNDRLSNLKVENTTVFLSPPDSTGKQHVIKESTTTASKHEQERMEIDESLSITLQQFSNQLDTLSNKVDAVLTQKEKIVELSWWDLHKDNVYCCVIGLLVVGWLVYRIRKK